MSDMPGLYCHRCETINPLGGVYGVNDKTYCEPCYIVMRRRIRKGLEPGAKELLG